MKYNPGGLDSTRSCWEPWLCGIISDKREKFRSKNNVRKLGGPGNHFPAVMSGQKTVPCDFYHLNIHRHNISRKLGWLLDLRTNFCHINYRSLLLFCSVLFQYSISRRSLHMMWYLFGLVVLFFLNLSMLWLTLITKYLFFITFIF